MLATARTLFPSSGGPVPALGNLHLLPYGVQEGEAFMQTDVGRAILGQIRERSTASFTTSSKRDMWAPFCLGPRSTKHSMRAWKACSLPFSRMRITFSTPVTPTRESETSTDGSCA